MCEYMRDQSITMSDVRQATFGVRGANHPLCFSDEVMQHQFPEGFKPISIKKYNETTDPLVWIEDFLMHVHMAGGNDFDDIKYLPLKLKGSTQHWHLGGHGTCILSKLPRYLRPTPECR
jgi:hypothetical protein